MPKDVNTEEVEEATTEAIQEQDNFETDKPKKASGVPSTPSDDFDESSAFEEHSIQDLENSFEGMENLDDFDDSMNFDNFIVLNKKDLSNFCRSVEPLVKMSIDDYGKSVFIKSIDENTVELRYFNKPYVLSMSIANKSGKTIKDFSLLVSTLKKLVTNAYASVIFVEEEGKINLALCESLLYLETKPLSEDFYNFDKLKCTRYMDKEIASYTFRKIGTMLNSSDRASEKVIVVKNNLANFSTGYFAAKTQSPFVESVDFIIFKTVSEVLGILADISKIDLKYEIDETDGKIAVSCDGQIYCELPIALGEKVEEFYSPVAENALRFTADITIINDTMLRLIHVVKTLDYLSDIISLSFTKTQMILIINNTNQTNPSEYSFNIVGGSPERIGEMKVSCDVLITFFAVTGTDIQYAFTEEGLGIKNEVGTFIIRRS